MSRISAVLAPLVLLCSVLTWTSMATAQPAGSQFIVFDGLAYQNKPDLTKLGMSKIRIAYTSEIWDGSKSRDLPNEAAVRKLARSADPSVPLVLDIEHWKVFGASPETDANIDKLIQIVTWIRQTNPNVKIGFYGLMPISDSWLELNYALAEQDPSMPNAPALVKTYQELQASNVRMRKLAQYVDFVCPVLYTLSKYGGGPAKYQTSWDTATINAIQEAQQYNKPIYAFLWPQMYDVKGQNGDNDFIPTGFWAHELEFLREAHIQGVIIWGATGFRKSGWNDNDPWWQATRAFLSR